MLFVLEQIAPHPKMSLSLFQIYRSPPHKQPIAASQRQFVAQWKRINSQLGLLLVECGKSVMCQNKRENSRRESVLLYLYLDVSILRWFIQLESALLASSCPPPTADQSLGAVRVSVCVCACIFFCNFFPPKMNWRFCFSRGFDKNSVVSTADIFGARSKVVRCITAVDGSMWVFNLFIQKDLK